MPIEPTTLDATELYQRVQQFYARQSHLLDAGDVTAWAATFTEDGVFAANAHPEPVSGRGNIERAARAAADDIVRRGLRRRHWLGMVDVTTDDDGTVRSRYYALVFLTPIGGQAALHVSTSGEDILVVAGGELLVRERRVTRDDLGGRTA
jgi:3-phenylpropionate/cinnamic acid dioxygenase small subunit